MAKQERPPRKIKRGPEMSPAAPKTTVGIALEEAIKKMTMLPAEKFGLKKRGKIAEKYFADILIISRDEIEDLAEGKLGRLAVYTEKAIVDLEKRIEGKMKTKDDKREAKGDRRWQ